MERIVWVVVMVLALALIGFIAFLLTAAPENYRQGTVAIALCLGGGGYAGFRLLELSRAKQQGQRGAEPPTPS